MKINFMTSIKDVNELLAKHRDSPANVKCLFYRASGAHDLSEKGYYPEDLRWTCRECGIGFKNHLHDDGRFVSAFLVVYRGKYEVDRFLIDWEYWVDIKDDLDYLDWLQNKEDEQ